MTGIRWRLLAVLLPIFVPSTLLPAQDIAVDRSAVIGPVADRGLDLKPVPNRSPLRYPAPLTAIWIPTVTLPRPDPIPPGTISSQPDIFLEQLVRTAGIIFAGSVTSVGTRTSSPGLGHASTVITFQVEHAIRGASVGQNLTIHEWAGLWSRGERYRVGEHVLLFLYAPSKLGLTSPVAGPMGRFAVDSRGLIVMSPHHIAIVNSDPMLAGKTAVPYADFAVAVRRVQPKGISEP